MNQRNTRRILASAVAALGAAGAVAIVVNHPPNRFSSVALSLDIPRGDPGSPGAGVFDDQSPSVARLDPALLDALRRAAVDAGAEGVEFVVTSGWRSADHQTRLLREAVGRYGSEAEAARWVATAETSAHVSGHAVDIGHSAATTWLSAHGAAYGLCQIYDNESWHYELRPDAVVNGCPARYADPTEDPRMRR
ncbi:M15 family metallopeptidase [Nocardia caishijiensis]|uniref:D-alanyl-D-alanine carboxypeptidase-like protein n=1 Tax=Nocardia caishijiensis TaxID=184756 RepID=A0ABQ6YG92_9NOCA|nr:M15 family metallopeptidase [Nocardia caishijiensis]KAF0844798.1 D-alanyl-D-alanine carboxypeptidase-like protein [Nocardia caishijiensis]